jgi:hypothetical protein
MLLLEKIKAIAAVNKEIVDRLLQIRGDIVSGYKYVIEVRTKTASKSTWITPLFGVYLLKI